MVKKGKASPKIAKSSIRGLEIDYAPHANFSGIAKEIFSSEKGATMETLYKVVKASPEVSRVVLTSAKSVLWLRLILLKRILMKNWKN